LPFGLAVSLASFCAELLQAPAPKSRPANTNMMICFSHDHLFLMNAAKPNNDTTSTPSAASILTISRMFLPAQAHTEVFMQKYKGKAFGAVNPRNFC
jgi:hypothetical protein